MWPNIVLGVRGKKKQDRGKQGGISEHLYVMYLIAAIKMAVYLVDIIDDVSQNHYVSNCSSTKTVASSNLSEHILTMIVAYQISDQKQVHVKILAKLAGSIASFSFVGSISRLVTRAIHKLLGSAETWYDSF